MVHALGMNQMKRREFRSVNRLTTIWATVQKVTVWVGGLC